MQSLSGGSASLRGVGSCSRSDVLVADEMLSGLSGDSAGRSLARPSWLGDAKSNDEDGTVKALSKCPLASLHSLACAPHHFRTPSIGTFSVEDPMLAPASYAPTDENEIRGT